VFGKKRGPVVDPDLALAPFEISAADAPGWVQLPLVFPTPLDRDFWAWKKRQCDLLRQRYPEIDPDDFAGPYHMITDGFHFFRGHAALWGLPAEPEQTGIDYVPMVFDVSDVTDTVPDSQETFQERLTARSDGNLAVRAEGYREREAAPARALPVDAAGLGKGVCVIRRDLHDVASEAINDLLDETGRWFKENPDYWTFSMSIHWSFTVAGKELTAATLTDKPGLLLRSLPRIHELLDAVRLPEHPRGPVDSELREAVSDTVSMMVADRAADEARLVVEGEAVRARGVRGQDQRG
jgi:hypothetical protein